MFGLQNGICIAGKNDGSIKILILLARMFSKAFHDFDKNLEPLAEGQPRKSTCFCSAK